jgi:hypothetical protein
VLIDNYLFYTLPIQNYLKNEEAFPSVLLNCALENAGREAQANRKRLQLNETHQLLVCIDYNHLLD